MTHVPYDRWLDYVKDGLDEKEREQYDNHLYDCDQCLALYLEAVEAVEWKLPMITKSDLFTDEIMAEIAKREWVEQPSVTKGSNIYQRAVFHYIVAAAMTLMLMFSGAFSLLLNVVSDFESKEINDTSIVSEIMDKSISIIDRVALESKEGE